MHSVKPGAAQVMTNANDKKKVLFFTLKQVHCIATETPVPFKTFYIFIFGSWTFKQWNWLYSKFSTFLCTQQVPFWLHKSVVLNTFWLMDQLFKKCLVDHLAMLAPHEQLVKTVLHKGQWMLFIKDLWNSLRTPRNSRWATVGPLGPRWESLAYFAMGFSINVAPHCMEQVLCWSIAWVSNLGYMYP